MLDPGPMSPTDIQEIIDEIRISQRLVAVGVTRYEETITALEKEIEELGAQLGQAEAEELQWFTARVS